MWLSHLHGYSLQSKIHQQSKCPQLATSNFEVQSLWQIIHQLEWNLDNKTAKATQPTTLHCVQFWRHGLIWSCPDCTHVCLQSVFPAACTAVLLLPCYTIVALPACLQAAANIYINFGTIPLFVQFLSARLNLCNIQFYCCFAGIVKLKYSFLFLIWFSAIKESSLL